MGEQSAFTIESNDLAIAQIFKDFYAVPDFQREYVLGARARREAPRGRAR